MRRQPPPGPANRFDAASTEFLVCIESPAVLGGQDSADRGRFDRAPRRKQGKG